MDFDTGWNWFSGINGGTGFSIGWNTEI